MNILLFGKGGQVGWELQRSLAVLGHVTALDHDSTDHCGDFANPEGVAATVRALKPDVIVNAAAHTAVDKAESEPELARLLNATTPGVLAREAAALGAWLVHYSTDYVFDGSGSRPWQETDTPAPLSVYGRTKLEGEQAVLRSLPERSCVLRTAWLFGPGRKNFVDTIVAACVKRDAINVVYDQVGSPTYSMDLAQWSAALAEKQATGLWHAVNSGQASWCELACESIALAAASCRVVPIDSSEWPQKARRPVFSVLDNSKLAEFLGKPLRPWPQALRDYIFSEYLPAHTNKGAAQ